LISIIGCANSSGTRLTQGDINTLVKGQTTYAEVINRFGEPTNAIRSAEILYASYSSLTAENQAENFIPVIGIFAGEHKIKSVDITLVFDARTNVLRDIIDRENVFKR
jgi:hypothetical protein